MIRRLLQPPTGSVEAEDVERGVVVDVAGVPFELHASDPARADAVASLFRHAVRSPANPAVEVRFAADDVTPPAGPPTVTGPHAQLWHTEAGTLFVRSDEGLSARADTSSLLIGGTCDGLAREFRFVCLNAAAHVLATRGWQMLHGAALAPGGGAVLVLGDTGTGKSTLAYASVRRGWSVLADDAVLLRRRGGSVVVRGFPRPIAVPADVTDGEDGDDAIAGGRAVPDDPRHRTELAPGTLSAADAPIVALLFTSAAAVGPRRASRLERMSAQDTFRSVLRASASLADPAHRPELFPIAGALARMPAWSVGHGSSRALEEANVTLDTLVDALTRQIA